MNPRSEYLDDKLITTGADFYFPMNDWSWGGYQRLSNTFILKVLQILAPAVKVDADIADIYLYLHIRDEWNPNYQERGGGCQCIVCHRPTSTIMASERSNRDHQSDKKVDVNCKITSNFDLDNILGYHHNHHQWTSCCIHSVPPSLPHSSPQDSYHLHHERAWTSNIDILLCFGKARLLPRVATSFTALAHATDWQSCWSFGVQVVWVEKSDELSELKISTPYIAWFAWISK